MPDLPTKTLSQAHYDRVVAAFPGTTMAQKAAAYDAWLTNHLIDHVESFEMNKINEEMAAKRNAAIENIRISLPPRVPYPPTIA